MMLFLFGMFVGFAAGLPAAALLGADHEDDPRGGCIV